VKYVPSPGLDLIEGPTVTCVICGFEGEGGLGHWACHADEDCTPVCRGPCFHAYDAAKRLGGMAATAAIRIRHRVKKAVARARQ
jgi:hypothetical protein